MRSFFYIIFCLLSCSYGYSQSAGSLTPLGKDWQEVENEKKAKYYLHKFRKDDSTWVYDYYNFKGPKIKQESFRDAAGTKPNGFFSYYSADGNLDSCGTIINKLKHGDWVYFNPGDDKFAGKKTFEYGILKESVNFRDPSSKTDKQAGERVVVPAEFADDVQTWQQFLNKNLRYPDRAIDLFKGGTVTVMFVVDNQGKIIDPIIQKSVEYSLDNESLRILKISPDWSPATEDGKKLKSWARQPITFKIEKG